MNESELRKLMTARGYVLDKIVPFQTKDRIRFHTEDGKLKISLNVGKKLRDISEKTILPFLVKK